MNTVLLNENSFSINIKAIQMQDTITIMDN